MYCGGRILGVGKNKQNNRLAFSDSGESCVSTLSSHRETTVYYSRMSLCSKCHPTQQAKDQPFPNGLWPCALLWPGRDSVAHDGFVAQEREYRSRLFHKSERIKTKSFLSIYISVIQSDFRCSVCSA